MGDSYQTVVKNIKKGLKKKYPDIKIVEDGHLLHFDVGFGEKLAVFVLPVWQGFSLGSLSGLTSVEVFLETVRRFVEVKPPKGYRARFIVFDGREEGLQAVNDHITSIGHSRVLILINLRELGLGNEKIVINGLSGRFIYRIAKTIRENGLSTGMINLRQRTLSDIVKGIDILEFVSFPNSFKDRLTGEMFDTRRRDFGVTLLTLILNSVLKHEMV